MRRPFDGGDGYGIHRIVTSGASDLCHNKYESTARMGQKSKVVLDSLEGDDGNKILNSLDFGKQ